MTIQRNDRSLESDGLTATAWTKPFFADARLTSEEPKLQRLSGRDALAANGATNDGVIPGFS